MKKYVFQAATLLVAATALLTGCDKTENVIEEPTSGLVKVVANATAGDTETRIAYSESGNRMNYVWGDLFVERFSVFVPGSNIKHEFYLRGGGYTRKGRFDGMIPEGTTITYAIYPGLSADPTVLTAIPHDLSNQGLYTNTDALFANRHHLMWSSADASDGELNYQFDHKISMLKLELTFTGVTSKIKSVSILGAHNKVNLNLTNGALSYEDAGNGAITASDAAGFDLVNNVLTAYVYLFPEDLSSETLTITAVDETGKAYTTGGFNGRLLNAGTVYRLRKDMSESEYIVVGDLKWAKGNLIADGPNGAKIGAPEDGGLYFQFGSLVGWSGCGNVDGTGRDHGNPLSIQVKPYTCQITTWHQYWFGDPTTDVPETGKGDPCRYYLGAPWRLPSKEDLNALFGQEQTFGGFLSWGDETDAVGWSKEGNFSENSTTSYASHISGLKFPLVGERGHSSGAHTGNGSLGSYWSSKGYFNNGDMLYIDNTYLIPLISTDRASGLPIRCVRE